MEDKKDAESVKPGMTLGFVLCDEYEVSDAGRLLAKYNELSGEDLKAADVSYEKNTVTFKIGGELAFVSFMPAPYPWSDLEGPCATSWLWRDAAGILKTHKRHIIITWMSKSEDEILKSTVVSRLCASVLEEVNGHGVYWGNAALVNNKDVFCGMVYDIENSGLPLFLWVDFRIEGNPDKTLNLITCGMSKFGVMELEIIETKKPFSEIIDFAYSIAGYLVQNGNVIKDGDTIGEDENQKIKATHSDSVWVNDNRGKVLRVHY